MTVEQAPTPAPRSDGDVVTALRAAMRGPVLGPDDAGYDAARRVFNAMIDRRPAVIARCAGAADVMVGVRFARERGLPLSVHGGGTVWPALPSARAA